MLVQQTTLGRSTHVGLLTCLERVISFKDFSSKFVCLLARIARNISNDDLEFVEKAQYSVLGSKLVVFQCAKTVLADWEIISMKE
jgi:hypothetical protein